MSARPTSRDSFVRIIRKMTGIKQKTVDAMLCSNIVGPTALRVKLADGNNALGRGTTVSGPNDYIHALAKLPYTLLVPSRRAPGAECQRAPRVLLRCHCHAPGLLSHQGTELQCGVCSRRQANSIHDRLQFLATGSVGAVGGGGGRPIVTAHVWLYVDAWDEH